MASGDPAQSLLLALPDACLLAVLQCCAADDHRSLFSAARAHSRLHQAAVLALRSINAVVTSQQQADGLLTYLDKLGWGFDSVSTEFQDDTDTPWSEDPDMTPPSALVCLPPKDATKLHSLQLGNLQLLVDDESQGALGTALKQLQLSGCQLLDGATGAALVAALSHLPGLEHLSLRYIDGLTLPTAVLQQQLTYLELDCVDVVGPDDGYDPDNHMLGSLALQPLQSLTRLADLRVMSVSERGDLGGLKVRITPNMLSGMHYLTRLELQEVLAEPSILAGRTSLQHLSMAFDVFVSDARAEATQVLYHMQRLQQLTHLELTHSYWVRRGDLLPAAAYSALTASSKLQHLDISRSTWPPDAWKHVFPTGRMRPHLRSLDISWATEECSSKHAFPPDGSRLVSCCPGLQSLDMQGLQHNAELLAPLQGLSALTTLRLTIQYAAYKVIDGPEKKTLDMLCQMTRLRELGLGHGVSRASKEALFSRLVQLTQLTRLTRLTWMDPFGGGGHICPGREDNNSLTSQVRFRQYCFSHNADMIWAINGGLQVDKLFTG
jgi:hypothetical protein